MTLALGGQRRGKEEGQQWAGGGEPFVFSQVQLLGLNRWHPIGGPRSGTRCSRWLRAGAGSFADACHSLPRQKQEEGMHRCYLHQGSHQECLGDIPRRWGTQGGVSRCWEREAPSDTNRGYCFLALAVYQAPG